MQQILNHSNTVSRPRRTKRGSRSYSLPETFKVWSKTGVRPILPLGQPILPTVLPELPFVPRQPNFSSVYALSTHLIPAAYPRTYPHASVPAPGPLNETSDARKTRISSAVKEVVRNRALYEQGALGTGSTAPLWCAVNRYVRRSLSNSHPGSRSGVTLFFAHASSIPKEIWEPIIEHMIVLRAQDPRAPEVDEIWSFEAVQHGDSALVNKGNLCGLYDGADGARDMLHFLRFYMPEATTSGALPTHLPRLPDATADARLARGFADRTVVGIGHSLGGTCLTLAAIAQPAFFRGSSIICIDPFICAPYCNAGPTIMNFVAGALARRSSWPSRAAALATFKANPFFASWDPAMLALYVDCALYRPSPTSDAVALKTDNVQEAILYECRIPFELWELVETLDPCVAVRWIMPSGRSVFGGDGSMAQELVWRRPQNSSNVIIDAGHMVPQEAPREVAQDIFDYLRDMFGDVRAKL